MTALTVVAYNVLFGDAILICVPERDGRKTVIRHVLVDVGNVLGDPDDNSQVFRSVFEDIGRRLDGRTIDLYVMTHEHMDHVQGLLQAHSNGLQLPAIDYAWLTASSSATYYERFHEASKQRSLHLAAYDRVRRIALQRGIVALAPVKAFLDNNNPRRTQDCVAFLRRLARKNTSYVHRGFTPVTGKSHPFNEARFSIWAPEHDTSSYYGRVRPVMQSKRGRKLAAPPGVEQDAFDALLEFSRAGLPDEMLAIDRAANNTSVVFSIEWRGWRLLFSGDAELRSWRTMERNRQLRPVHFVKVGHHASHNGTPSEDVLERILPLRRRDSRRRTALVSTCEHVYNGVPDHDTLARFERRVDSLVLTTQVAVGSAVEIRFDDRGGMQ
jgi:beta-lactamase superfamily II metal-dependent hydrolase